jgi:tRNA (guanine-N7-)-methyltransferase
MKGMSNVLEHGIETVRADNFSYKGKWKSDYFQNEKPIVLELACGKGEFAVAMSKIWPERNYVGVDIKGARMYIGARQALDEELKNVAFLRTRIDFIESFFEVGEVDEIWITFPDPQPQKNRARKRLTSPMFIDRYRKILKPGGIINLKTDSDFFYEYTKEQIEEHGYKTVIDLPEMYDQLAGLEDHLSAVLQTKTHYEKLFTEKGATIKFLQLSI